MAALDTDTGVITELLDRFNHLHLPRVMEIKDRLDEGQLLLETDIEFLTVVLTDSQNMRGYIERNPDFKPLAAKISHFYYQIIEIATENEHQGKYADY
ncbi:hypothetical protein FLL45_09510 [Aliikangiella marina]|uniref:Uncharacterized protein n=1 Tax=Aliikangiella marina TaxID=1712262 RepID=A0A545TD72_9GAMM|nr:hypothetical protein [Aliikangiella marina]TQV75165.1 hypothetical protein FLL45_09510 [Aliikangiella marina]